MTNNEYAILFARQHRAYERRVYSVFYNGLKKQIQPVLDFMESNGSISDSDIDSLIRHRPMEQAYQTAYEIIGVMAAKREYLLLRKENPVKADPLIQFFSQRWASWMRSFAMTDLADMIQNVTGHTREQVRYALSQAYEQGLTFREQIKLIREYTTGEIGRSRALTIARTESTRAAAEGKRVGATDWANEFEIKLYKKWVPRLDEETRPAHIAMEDDLPVKESDKFTVGGEKMTQPGDKNASAGNTVNCRCTIRYIPERIAIRDYGVS